MNLPTSNIKAIFVASFLGLTLAPNDSTHAAPASVPAAPPLPAPSTPSPAATPEPAASKPGVCGAEMILVDGDACPDAEQVCLKWIDPPPYSNLRCAEYAKPAKCKVARVHRRFCIDREEYVQDTDSGLPLVGKNWNEAQDICKTRGARLCKESEWEFACEGTEMSPYPYGWKRDSNVCNFDKTNLGGAEDKLHDLRAKVSEYPECKSPFGVHDMVGNVDEWVEREGLQPPNRSALRGGWWLPGRNRCRAATTAHAEDYAGKQVGFRCCKAAPEVTADE